MRNPDVIFTNYPGDMSTDHNMTGTIVSRVMLSLPGKNVPADEPPMTKAPSLFYWDTAAGLHFEPEVYVDISDVIDLKLEALSKHKSQYEWMSVFMKDNFLENCKILGRFRGTQAGYKYAEGFRSFRIHGYMPNFKLLP